MVFGLCCKFLYFEILFGIISKLIRLEGLRRYVILGKKNFEYNKMILGMINEL